MDWHKLQHKLFELDPVDTRAELEQLKKAAQTTQAESVPDLINESYEVAAGSMPLGIDSISEFAALAGIRLDEKQLKGPAGQARGSDPWPTAQAGRTKHPLKDKLVGEEGTWDKIKRDFSHGRDNYNRLSLFSRDKNNFNAPSPTDKPTQQSAAGTYNTTANISTIARTLQVTNLQQFSTAMTSAMQGNTLSNRDQQLLGQAFQRMLLLQESDKRKIFAAMLSLTPQQPSRPTTPTTPTQTTTTADQTRARITSSRTNQSTKQTIKEHLLQLLEEKKLK
jgi:hypothetical protein